MSMFEVSMRFVTALQTLRPEVVNLRMVSMNDKAPPKGPSMAKSGFPFHSFKMMVRAQSRSTVGTRVSCKRRSECANSRTEAEPVLRKSSWLTRGWRMSGSGVLMFEEAVEHAMSAKQRLAVIAQNNRRASLTARSFEKTSSYPKQRDEGCRATAVPPASVRPLERIRDIRASERRMYLRVREIFALAADYAPTLPETTAFFRVIQNKLHYAVSGQTAAEIIRTRADHTQPNMGLTTTRKGQVQKADVGVAKNYLTKEELDSLGRIVNAYLELAEDRARRKIPMSMEDWSKRLDAFLEFDDRDVLKDSGRISAKLAQAHFRNALHLFPLPESGWSPKVLLYSGYYGTGIKEIWDMVDDYVNFTHKNGYFNHRRNE